MPSCGNWRSAHYATIEHLDLTVHWPDGLQTYLHMHPHLAEIVLHGPHLRSFGLALEGVPVLTDLDLAALHGVQYGSVFATRAAVAGPNVDLEVLPGAGPLNDEGGRR